MLNRRRFMATVATVGAAAATRLRLDAEALPAELRRHSTIPRAGAPNVLIFMPDQQNGATVLPGSPVVKPNMDRFLREGVLFNSAYCPAAHCCPSRASFMSGKYPSEHGVYNNVMTDSAIHANPYPGTPYWGTYLRDAGYQMGYAGKLHVGRDVTPETCGFENLSRLEQGDLEDNERAITARWRLAQVEESVPAHRKRGEMLRPEWTNSQLYKTFSDSGPQSYENLADFKIMQAGIAGLTRMAATGRPWCVMISNSGSHNPYYVPKQFVEKYDPAKIQLPSSFEDALDDKPRIYQRMRYELWSQLSDAESKEALLHYYAKCTMQDALFGTMLDALDATGQADNTIVLYVSDHGDYSAAHGLWMKGIPAFREGYHVPCVVRWPRGVVRPGRQVDAFVEHVDYGPTILDACGVASGQQLSGVSLVPWLKAQMPSGWRHVTCSQMNGVELYYTQRAVMTKEWKYVYNGFDYDELYDLTNDPHEIHNLAFPNLAAKRREVVRGEGLLPTDSVPWPALPGEFEAVRKDLLREMWSFAAKHHDYIFSPSPTVALAPYGSGVSKDPPPTRAPG